MVKYVIEHLEPRLYKWCMLEYQHISKIVGKKNLVITNLRTDNAMGKMKGLAKCYKESVVELKFGKELVLDPITDKTLTTKDCEKYDYLIFGGILGDYPMRRRTKSMLSKKLKAPVRNLGKKQMPTDNAVYVAK